jgi:xylulokinase
LSGIINTTGKAIEWGAEFLTASNFDGFFSLAQKSKPGSGGLIFLPYLAGERTPIWNPNAGALWKGIGINSNRSDFANSILEGIGFAIKDVLAVMEEAGANLQTSQLRVTGGLAKNAYLNQIKADISGKEILEPKYRETELLGLAIIGSHFMSKSKPIAEASSAMVKTEKHYEPNLHHTELYNELFNEYVSQRMTRMNAN